MYKTLFMAAALLLAPAITAANTTFTYQGQLETGGTPLDGTVTMEFSLFDETSGGSQHGTTITELIDVTDGLFQVELDFGNQSFDATSGLWLEIAVEGTTLAPRQRITAAPLAIRSLDAGSGSLWVDEVSGISYQGGNVAIGHPSSGSPQTLSVRSESGEDPFTVLNDSGVRTLHAQNNSGVTIGGFFLAPDAGLMVHGDAAQTVDSHGFAKAGVDVICGSQGASPGQIANSFNNVPTASPSGEVTYLPDFDEDGNCRLELGFPVGNAFIMASPVGVTEGLVADCGPVQTTRVRCRVRNLGGDEVTRRIYVMVF